MKQVMIVAALIALGLGGCASRSFSEPPREAVGLGFGPDGFRRGLAVAVTSGDFSWLEGCWVSRDGDQFEGWSGPDAAGARSGVAVVSTGGVEAFREGMDLEVLSGGARFTARLPQGAPTTYRLTAAGDGWARFENPRHDDPKVILYDRDQDRLRAWIGDGPARTRLVLDARAVDCPRAG